MITSTGVGVGGVGGIGMLRARRRDVSVKPNRKLDRKSSRGMIYENEELRLRTIQINAEVEQGQSDIKKLRRENEQLRREIWCLREEYDKLEEILKTQKSRGNSDESEGGSDDEDIGDDYSNGSQADENDEMKKESDTVSDDDDNEKEQQIITSNELMKDELFENAENQKLSSEKNSNRYHVVFNQLSIVDEEDELTKNKEKTIANNDDITMSPVNERSKTTSNIIQDEYLNGHSLGWIINPESPSLPSMKKQSSVSNSTPGISTIIKCEGGGQALQPLPSPSSMAWEWENFQGDTGGHTLTTMDRQPCAESIARASSCRLPRDITELIAFSNIEPTNMSIINTNDENNVSTMTVKTSPDICVTGAIASSQRTFGSSDQLLSNNSSHDSMSKSYSCQELGKSTKFFNSTLARELEAKSLPDYSIPRAYKSQLKIQLNKLPIDTPSQMPPKMLPIDCTARQLFYKNTESTRQLPVNEYQATSFENPTPQNLTLSSSIPLSVYTKLGKSERKIVQVCANVPLIPSKVVDTQTQTLKRSSTQSLSHSRSSSSSSVQHQEVRKNFKSLKFEKLKQTKSPTNKIPSVSIRSSDDMKNRHDDKSERQSSSSGHDCQKKTTSKSSRYSQGTKKRVSSSRSQSIIQNPEISESTTVKEHTISMERTRKNSVASDSVPWCACWGNGCV